MKVGMLRIKKVFGHKKFSSEKNRLFKARSWTFLIVFCIFMKFIICKFKNGYTRFVGLEMASILKKDWAIYWFLSKPMTKIRPVTHFRAKSIRPVAESNPLLQEKWIAGSILRFYIDRNKQITRSFFSADAPNQAL